MIYKNHLPRRGQRSEICSSVEISRECKIITSTVLALSPLIFDLSSLLRAARSLLLCRQQVLVDVDQAVVQPLDVVVLFDVAPSAPTHLGAFLRIIDELGQAAA